jgi:hypothetical protein
MSAQAGKPAQAGAGAGSPASGGQPALAGASGAGSSTAGRGGAGELAPGDGSQCAKAEYEAKIKPLQMMILLDQSGSMTEHDDRWTPVTLALKKFVSSGQAAGMGVGLQYFPLAGDDDAKCAPATYAPPDVALSDLPGNAQAMVASIDAHHFTKDNCCDASEHQGTPTRPALEGVMSYLRTWLGAHPDHHGVILLATDGEPSECDDNDIEDVSRVIGEAAKATPAIPTYVVGIGDEEDLGELAEAGGTGAGAFLVDGTGMETEQQLLAALAKIRGEALSCDFPLPEGMDADPSNVNVQRTKGQESPRTLVQVPGEGECVKATHGGWYYDDAGTRLHLCPTTCNEVLADPTSKLAIVVGCAAVLL